VGATRHGSDRCTLPMTLRWSLLALVLLVLCGGVELVWTAMPAEVATECPVAPEAPVDAEPETGGEEAIVWPCVATGRDDRIEMQGERATAVSAERTVGTPPPRA